MNRLVSMLMLAAFAAQHFVCCCSGLGTHACDQGHCAPEPVCAIANGLDQSASHGCGHDHSGPCDVHDSEQEKCPSNDSHGHHVCVAAHVFFTPTPRASVPQSTACQYGLWCCDSATFVASTSLSTAIREGVDLGPPLSSRERRSALGVYRI